VNVEHGLPPNRGGAGSRPGSPGPRRLAPPGGPPRPVSRDRPDPATPPAPAPASGRRSGSGPAPARSGGAALATPPPVSRGPRRLAPPRQVKVRADAAGRPHAIGGRAVEAIRESWLVEDRWWTDAPLRRRYWEVVTADGRDLVVFRDLQGGRWFAQR
jgi:hypothetical protein